MDYTLAGTYKTLIPNSAFDLDNLTLTIPSSPYTEGLSVNMAELDYDTEPLTDPDIPTESVTGPANTNNQGNTLGKLLVKMAMNCLFIMVPLRLTLMPMVHLLC